MNFLLAASADFHPEEEFHLETWVDLGLLSINKAVVYLWLGGLVTILLAIWVMRFGLRLKPSRRQTSGEAIYELVQSQIAEGNLPHKAIKSWFPYVASLFLFIWVLNIISFIPLPISNDKFSLWGLEIPTFGLYAATSNLMVTLALALITFFATHVEGIRYNGPTEVLQELDPERRAEGTAGDDRPARDHLAVHAADLALRPSLCQHARRPHADPRHARPHHHLRLSRDRGHRRARRAWPSTSSRSGS